MYIDYDKSNMVFYHNFFFEVHKFVLKIALTPPVTELFLKVKEVGEENLRYHSDLKIERFNLARYVYLLHYD